MVDNITLWVSKPVSFLVCAMMGVTTVEVVGRYVFNRPTIWAWPVNRQLFGIFILVAGSYSMSRRGHIRIELIYDRLPKALKWCGWFLGISAFIGFMGTLVWQSGWMGINSFMSRELLAGVFRIPLYPFKLLIPVFAFLFLVQGIAVFWREREHLKKEDASNHGPGTPLV